MLCQRTECTGKIVDGFCEDCGKPVTSSVKTNTSTQRRVDSSNSRSMTGRGSQSGSSRRGSRGSRLSSGRLLGAGFVSLPELPSEDPLNGILADPTVPERKLFCGSCDAKVSREKGFCPACGAEYNFIPTLSAGDLLENQYEIKGPLAFGGLGWIYLGWDTVLSRWVVLKGLLNSKDPASAAAAMAERQFLAAVKHPKIVNIYNFITRGTEGFIVMEYVGGKTLKSLRQARGPLPVEEALAYIHGVLPAFAYLHKQGFVYCDFKPDNCMLEGDDVKLIDLGGVRLLDDTDGDIYGTKGYSAPEGGTNPSVASDLYTVARTLAVLLFDFSFQSAFQFSIPPATDQPILAEHDSLRRWLVKATRSDPDARFQSAEEMADQLLGVLRDVVSKKSGSTKRLESNYFQPEAIRDSKSVDSCLSYRLPALKMDTSDPVTNALVGIVGMPDAYIQESISALARKFVNSMELLLFAAQSHLEANRPDDFERVIKEAETVDALDWRILWYRACFCLAKDLRREAIEVFDLVMDELPGEVTPRLAKALAYERAGDYPSAITLYHSVTVSDPSYVGAHFGEARCQSFLGRRREAVEALSKVPPNSSLIMHSKVMSARMLIRNEGSNPETRDLELASEVLQSLTLEGYERARLSSDLFLAALDNIKTKGISKSTVLLLEVPHDEYKLRLGAEKYLRETAKFVTTAEERSKLVDQANSIRPWSWL